MKIIKEDLIKQAKEQMLTIGLQDVRSFLHDIGCYSDSMYNKMHIKLRKAKAEYKRHEDVRRLKFFKVEDMTAVYNSMHTKKKVNNKEEGMQEEKNKDTIHPVLYRLRYLNNLIDIDHMYLNVYKGNIRIYTHPSIDNVEIDIVEFNKDGRGIIFGDNCLYCFDLHKGITALLQSESMRAEKDAEYIKRLLPR